jgi:hypothetical protein
MTTEPETIPYKAAAATDVLQTFRRFGWVPPSEDPAYHEKWAKFKADSLLINVSKGTSSVMAH